jgi:hypothetical protein
MPDPATRAPDQIRQAPAFRLRAVKVSVHFQAILGCLLGEDWTTPRLLEMIITIDGQLLGRGGVPRPHTRSLISLNT